MHDLSDTIAAMATAPGDSGIGIIRISGKAAIRCADAVFQSVSGTPCSRFRNFSVHYGKVVRRGPEGAGPVDEALLTVMRAPKSYTREDVVEISCHGGIVAMRAVLELVLANGCRLAEPGEFTRRAFLNGRIDLSQAEAVLDVIRAKTDAALRTGVRQLQGDLSRQLDRIRDILLGSLAELEASIDFPEEGQDRRPVRPEGLGEGLRRLEELLKGCERGRIYREGIEAVICGRPNVGKSSLLNALLKEERSIVTPVAGTTRDLIEEVIDIRGIPVRVVDTAGILEPRDLVEKKAVARAKERIASADIIIAVFDGSRGLDAQDLALMRRLPRTKKTIAVINKADLKRRVETTRIAERFGDPVELSARKRKNLAALEEAIASAAGCGGASGEVLVSNLRHIQQLKKVKKTVEDILNYRDNEVPPECAAQDLRDACASLDRLQGREFSEDLLERIFGRFCIGK